MHYAYPGHLLVKCIMHILVSYWSNELYISRGVARSLKKGAGGGGGGGANKHDYITIITGSLLTNTASRINYVSKLR